MFSIAKPKLKSTFLAKSRVPIRPLKHAYIVSVVSRPWSSPVGLQLATMKRRSVAETSLMGLIVGVLFEV